MAAAVSARGTSSTDTTVSAASVDDGPLYWNAIPLEACAGVPFTSVRPVQSKETSSLMVRDTLRARCRA
ncbi:hypothetical protein RHS03_05574, partial [Rhizoctonia solani]